MEAVTRTTNAGDPFMTRHNLPVDSTDMMVNEKAKNTQRSNEHYQSLYKQVFSDPYTNGRAAIKISSPLNKFGMAHFIPTPTRSLYNVGLPTGGGRDPLKPLIPPKKHSMCGE
jgi:hypothetical protein